ncbi:MAG: GNAT family N-acetyltransferase [Clostridium sp.]|uniref:GNAT family N-acetyltransferase n=1 Tax=Clostridium sp. TaxID=1506 RepID=UPI003D6D5C73
MRIHICNSLNIKLVIEAITKVKAEEDDAEFNELAITNFLTHENNYFLVAIEGECVVGYAIGYIQNRVDTLKDMMCLYEVGVLKKFRRQGIARMLINELIEICHNINVVKMWVPTNKSNTSACTLYEKTGGIASASADEVIYTYRL